MGYDFSQLSSVDFEELVCDLLQEEYGKRLELFKPGKDGGIDCRNVTQEGTIVVQCKHYVRSGFQKLFDKLKKEEFDKVSKINPYRYVLATSVPLSPYNKKKISDVFGCYIITEGDIFGQDDLNALLRQHHDIEKRHFKLWLSSSAVLDSLLHNGVLKQSHQLVDRIHEDMRLFVKNDSFLSAIEILNKNRFVIISGEPGIGKTTLADMILLHYIDRGYRPIEVRDPRDAYDLYHPETRTIFYFDDFLGLTRLGDHAAKTDTSDIVKLIDLVTRSHNCRMILTSREFVLSQALQIDERIANSGFLRKKYQLTLANYTRLIKAKILFNHLWFSNLESTYIESIIDSRGYRRIINHPHYSPRVIQWMTKNSQYKYQPINRSSFLEQFLAILDNPKELWKHPFKQISQAARNMLLVFFSLGIGTDAARLQECFVAYHDVYCKQYGSQFSPQDYRDATE